MSHIAKYFKTLGFVTVGFDFRGHGKSEDLPGYIDNYQTLVDDFLAFVDIINEIYPSDIPKFTISQSLGGLVSFLAGLKLEKYFNGMVFLAPCLKTHENLNLSMKACKFFSYLIPRYQITFLPRKNDSSKNPEVFEGILKDKLIYAGGIRPRTIASIALACDEVEIL